ncbi:MAG: DUF2207 domain-containing protein [Ignavibacteriales bacterium]|nr:DUF2207 domain-containing protein [Ignavibacteriales bacterium]
MQFVSVTPPSGTIGYAKDEEGNVMVTGWSDKQCIETDYRQLWLKRMKWEYSNPITILIGKYTVEYSYILHPPIEYDSTTSHLNLKFAGRSHIPYRNIRITIPAKDVEQVYAYPPFMRVRNDGDTYTITGSAAANENVAVELLATVDGFFQIHGIRTEVADLKSKTASGSFWYNLPYFVANVLNLLAKAGVILVPILLIYLYYRYGREKMFTVPEYLSTIPNPSLKPWQVNLLFKDDALDFDEDGYYATLLELHRRKHYSINRKGDREGYRDPDSFYGNIRSLRATGACFYPAHYQRMMFLILTKLKHWQRQRRAISTAEEKALQYSAVAF